MPENHPAAPGTAAASRRVRSSAHSTAVPNAVLLGYASLTDGARLTYMVLESYDWPDKDGFSKGCCWPSIETIATARGKSYESISRHLKELEAAGLIRVESGQERGATNRYWLLGPSQEEFAAYLERSPEKAPENASYYNNEASNKTPQEGALQDAEKASNLSRSAGASLPLSRPARGSEAVAVEPRASNCGSRWRWPGPGANKSLTVAGGSSLAQTIEAPQKCLTRSGKNAGGGPAKMWEKEHEFKESKIKIDSNQILSRMNRGGVALQKQPRSPYISQILLDFSKSLNDSAHARSNQSQAQNLFRQSGMDEPAFVQLLYEAKKRTQWAAIATPKTVGQGPNRAAYFFKVVRNLLAEKSRFLLTL